MLPHSHISVSCLNQKEYRYLKTIFSIILVFTFPLSNRLVAAPTYTYTTQVIQKNIKTLRLSQDLLYINSDDVINISFDELSHNVHQYSYTVYHLNADKSRDDLNSNEYLHGFSRADITDYSFSFNTQQLYTHYQFSFPNEDMQPTLTGNYAIVIYEDGQEEKPIATAVFYVVSQNAQITANVRSNTNIELSGRYQQLDIDVSLFDVRHLSPNEFTLVVEQNNRHDNRVYAPRPTYIESSALHWKDCRELIFEGGNEYQHFDISSVYFKGNNVDQIYFDHTYYHAFLFPSEIRSDAPYLSEPDGDGSFVINAERTDDDDTDADYMFVHFILPCSTPWFDGSIYLLGDAWHNLLTDDNRMRYDNEHKAYTLSCYLKQGGYEWLYGFLPKGASRTTLQRVEGSHWQTGNTYRIFLYHRPFGERYDKLIGIQVNKM